MPSPDQDFSREFLNRAATAEVVSFDLFDTLILRDVLDPADIFTILGRRLDIQLDFRDLREDAHKRAREKFRPRVQNHEATLDEIYLELAAFDLQKVCGLDANDIMALELEIEGRYIRANDFMLSVFRSCLNSGRRVIITSDTYFSRPFLEGLLARCGYVGYEELVISSEVGRAKHDGSIWPWLIAHLGVAPGRLLHVGDNPGADVKRPRAAGVKCLHYPSALSLALADREYQRIFRLYSADELVADPELSSWLSLIANEHFATRPAVARGDFDWIGFAYFGMVMVLFTHWLHRNATEEGVEKLFFLARDGFFLERLYTTLYPVELGGLPSQYVYASRRALQVPSISALDDETVQALVGVNRDQPVRFFFELFEIDAEHHIERIEAAGFSSPDSVVTRRDWSRISRLLRSMEVEILRQASVERQCLEAYLRQLGAFSVNSVGLIDVGWNGSLQSSYERLVHEFWGVNQKVNGYYLGLRQPTAVHKKIGSLRGMRGFLCNLGLPRRNLSLVHDGATLMEFFLYAPHGTTLRFHEVGGQVGVVLDQTKVTFNVEASARMQAAASRLSNLTRSWGLHQVLDFEPFVRPLLRLVHKPTRHEAHSLGGFMLSTEVGRYAHMVPMARPILGNPLKTWREFKRSNWPQGFLSQVPLGRALVRFVADERVKRALRIVRKLRRGQRA